MQSSCCSDGEAVTFGFEKQKDGRQGEGSDIIMVATTSHRLPGLGTSEDMAMKVSLKDCSVWPSLCSKALC